ncbi:MAG TPA: hypothetical protein DIC36_07955 [Gammaproteobacteria bacterium]|nr:hypothetical protein [Gammaproteobacteria bacterium]
MNDKSNVKLILRMAIAFLAMGGLGNAWAECVQQSPASAGYSVADTVAVVDGTTGCAAINGQVGCRITNGVGTCTAKDVLGNNLFTAYSNTDSTGRITWTVDPSSRFKADSALLGGGQSGNACGFFYKNDASGGQGLAFAKSNGGISNVTYLDVCTNLKVDEPPPAPKLLPTCPADVQAALDEGTIPGDYAIVGTITDSDSATFCVKSGVQIKTCINEEGKNLPPTAPGKTPRCSEGPNSLGSPPFKRNLTFSMSKTGDSSQIFVCLPPTYTFAGNQSCAWVTY